MGLEKLYTGLIVKHKSYEGEWEIERIDDYTMTVWCKPINSINFELKEFKLQDLQEYKRR